MLIFDPTLEGGASLDDFEAVVSLAATIAMEWRGDRGGRLTAMAAGPDAAVLDGSCGPVHSRRVLERLAVVEPTLSAPPDAALLERLAAAAYAGVVVVGAGRSRLAGTLRKTLQRPITCLDAAALRGLDFYEPPEAAP